MIDAPLSAVPFLPELRLHQAAPDAGLFDRGYHSDDPPPFWAFAWPGGVALARHVLDYPETVTGLRVLDLAAGSGVVAVAAALAHASRVRATDVDRIAIQSVRRNAEANGVTIEADCADVLDDESVDSDVILVGDGFYSPAMAGRMMRFLRRGAEAGKLVLVGDPDREFLPRKHFIEIARYDVPVRPALEDVSVKPTTIWRLP